MPLYGVRTTAKREEVTCKKIAEQGEGQGVYATIAPKRMRGYVMVESENQSVVERVVSKIPNANKLVEGEASIREIEEFLEPSSDVEGVNENDIVRVTGGALQRQKSQS